ncbi:MAG: type IX secretion system membrane protein PorP/SprF, partial [Cytophagales bacterium]|nr:type IX secretion system membrane protein PorP/SprF [Cytophagales bacterium]
AINPAYAGNQKQLHATVLHRNQWIGFNGAPITNSVNATWDCGTCRWGQVCRYTKTRWEPTAICRPTPRRPTS